MKLFILLLLFYIHWGFFLFICSYVFIRKIWYNNSACRVLDVCFVMMCIATMLSWCYFKGECIISYAEKKILQPTYKLGDNPGYHPSLHFGHDFGYNINYITYFGFATYIVISCCLLEYK